MRRDLIKRLEKLRKVEFACVFLLPAVLFLNLAGRNIVDWKPYAYSMSIVSLILMEGALYWHLKLTSIKAKRATLPTWFSGVYRLFCWLNILLLIGYPALWILGNGRVIGMSFHPSVWANLLYVFAVLEHINYFHYQLSHDNKRDLSYLLRHRRLRRASLSLDWVCARKG